MRIVKKVAKDEKALFASKIFDECLKEYPNKLMIDSLELRISKIDALIIEEDKAIISLSGSNKFFLEEDEKALRSIFYEYLNRIFVKKSLDKMPPLIENVIVSRETAKMLGDDYLYYLHLKTIGKRPANFEEYLNLSIPWIAFFPVDEAAAEILYNLSKNKTYEAKAKSLFAVLKKNLWFNVNFEKAIKKARRLNASS